LRRPIPPILVFPAISCYAELTLTVSQTTNAVHFVFSPFGCEAQGGGHGFLNKTLIEKRIFLLSIQLAQDMPVLRKLSLRFQA
jgi:hypothetical protein